MKTLAFMVSLVFVLSSSFAVAGIAPSSSTSAAQRSGAKIKAPEKKQEESTDSHDANH
jgi:hypothetical protein